MLASLATIMKQKLDVVTPLVYFAFTLYLLFLNHITTANPVFGLYIYNFTKYFSQSPKKTPCNW